MTKLTTGLLWFDDDPDCTIEEKVLQAATRYREKYGHPPNVCYVNPADFITSATTNPPYVEAVNKDIEIYPLHTILRHHLWIGVAKTTGT